MKITLSILSVFLSFWAPICICNISLTFRHYKGGRLSAKRTGRLYPRRHPWYSFSEAESTSGHMVLSGVPRKKSLVTPTGIDPRTVRLVAQLLNHYITRGPNIYIYIYKYIFIHSIFCLTTGPKPPPFTGCPRRNVQYFGRVFLMLNSTDTTQNTYIQSWTVT